LESTTGPSVAKVVNPVGSVFEIEAEPLPLIVTGKVTVGALARLKLERTLADTAGVNALSLVCDEVETDACTLEVVVEEVVGLGVEPPPPHAISEAPIRELVTSSRIFIITPNQI